MGSHLGPKSYPHGRPIVWQRKLPGLPVVLIMEPYITSPEDMFWTDIRTPEGKTVVVHTTPVRPFTEAKPVAA